MQFTTDIPNIAFIGGGNMAQAIIKRLIETGFSPTNLFVQEKNLQKCMFFRENYAVFADFIIDIKKHQIDIVILAVKPQQLKAVCEQLRGQLDNKLVISIAAGVSVKTISMGLGQPNLAIIRAMPNMAVAIGLGATGLFAHSTVAMHQKSWAEQLMQVCGITVWVENEDLMAAVVAVSGSGPAYFFYMVEAMIKAGTELGLDKDIAQKLAQQTALGAAHLLYQSEESPQDLRAAVTSSKGTTEQAILSLMKDEFKAVMKRAMVACAERDQAIASALHHEILS